MGFGCECGYAWKGTLPETRQHEGEYLTLIERERWLEEASEAIASFVQADHRSRSPGRRGARLIVAAPSPERIGPVDVLVGTCPAA